LFDRPAFVAVAALCNRDGLSLPRYFSARQVARNFRPSLYPNIDGPQSGNPALSATQIADICERDRRPLLQVYPVLFRPPPPSLSLSLSLSNIRIHFAAKLMATVALDPEDQHCQYLQRRYVNVVYL
jgi:hypothetical protein